MTKPLTDPTFYHYLGCWPHDYAAAGWTYEQLKDDLKARGFDFDPHYHLGEFAAYLTAAGYPPAVEAPACPHPAQRLYAWWADDPSGPVLCVACCECGAVLQGGATLEAAA